MQQEQILIAPYGINDQGECNQPNPTQQRVLDWVDTVRKKSEDSKTNIPVLLLKGGVGSGKSRGVLAPVIEMLIEVPGLRVLWGREDFKDLKLSIMDKFFEIMPQELIVGKNMQYSYYDIRTKDPKRPSRIYFNGLKDLSGLGSQEFGVIAVTEAHETTEMAFRTLKRRCRQVGAPNMILMESEPPNEDHWITRLTNKALEEYDKDIEVWELSTYENWNNLPAAYRGSLESMPKSWQRKYLYGKTGFIPDGRPFYEGFKEQIHVGDYNYNNARELIVSFDFGFHHPAVSFHQFDENGWVVLDEFMGNEITIYNFCNALKSFININFPEAKLRCYGDPACLQNNDKSEKTSHQICKEFGFDLKCKQSTYRTRKEIIDLKLSTLVNGKPLLKVSRKCKIIIDGFLGGYHYPERKTDQQMTQRFEEPFHDDYYSHLMNTVEYVAINVFTPIKKAASHALRYGYKKNEENAGFSFTR